MKCVVAIMRVVVRSVPALSSLCVAVTTGLYLTFLPSSSSLPLLLLLLCLLTLWLRLSLLILILVLLLLTSILFTFTRYSSAALLASNRVYSTSVTRASSCAHALP